MNAYFHFLYLFLFFLFLFSSPNHAERLRGVWVYGVSPSYNKYRKRNGETAAGRGSERYGETKETDTERKKDKENRRPGGVG